MKKTEAKERNHRHGSLQDLKHNRKTESTVDNPVRLVWDLCEEMKGKTRKAVITEAVRRGVAFYTARTQYQSWRTAVMASQQTRKA